MMITVITGRQLTEFQFYHLGLVHSILIGLEFQEKSSQSRLAVRFTAKKSRKNLGELNFQYANGSPRTKMHLNPCQNMPRVQEHLTELSFLHFSGRGNWFSEGHLSDLPMIFENIDRNISGGHYMWRDVAYKAGRGVDIRGMKQPVTACLCPSSFKYPPPTHPPHPTPLCPSSCQT